MPEDKERGMELSWAERVLFRAVYLISLFLMGVMKVMAILLIFGFLALLVVFAWLLLAAVL
jgi:hypothetical protein